MVGFRELTCFADYVDGRRCCSLCSEWYGVGCCCFVDAAMPGWVSLGRVLLKEA